MGLEECNSEFSLHYPLFPLSPINAQVITKANKIPLHPVCEMERFGLIKIRWLLLATASFPSENQQYEHPAPCRSAVSHILVQSFESLMKLHKKAHKAAAFHAFCKPSSVGLRGPWTLKQFGSWMNLPVWFSLWFSLCFGHEPTWTTFLRFSYPSLIRNASMSLFKQLDILKTAFLAMLGFDIMMCSINWRREKDSMLDGGGGEVS